MTKKTEPVPLEESEDLFYTSCQMEIENLTHLAAEELIFQDNIDAAMNKVDERIEKSKKRLKKSLQVLIAVYYLRGNRQAEEQLDQTTLYTVDDINLIQSLAYRGYKYIDDIFDELRQSAEQAFLERETALKNLRTALTRADNRFRMMAGTESMVTRDEAMLMVYRKIGRVFFVRWVVTVDERTCDICMTEGNQIYRIEEATGKIPRHPYCRCYWEPVNREELIRAWAETKKQEKN